MSELKNTSYGCNPAKRALLSTVSTFVLLIALSNNSTASVAEDDHQTVWIELGGQLERVDGGSERFIPPFVSTIEANGILSPTVVQTPPRYSNGAEGKISFEPSGTDWSISVAVRYGRSNGGKSTHDALPRAQFTTHVGTREILETVTDAKFSDTDVKLSETHAILDFSVGRDVGLGLFGRDASSKLSFGIRFAQFTSTGVTAITAEPDYHTFLSALPPPFHGYFRFPIHHTYVASAHINRSFSGLGPSIAWEASKPVAGTDESGKLSVDWGVNAALLFGRQKNSNRHSTYGKFTGRYNIKYPIIYSSYRAGAASDRSRSVITPNVGGLIGASFRIENVKASMGYRADVFFGAMDGGIDTRKTYNREFYGPFATISIGLGGQ